MALYYITQIERKTIEAVGPKWVQLHHLQPPQGEERSGFACRAYAPVEEHYGNL